MNVQTYTDKSDPALVVHAVQISEMIPIPFDHPDPRLADPQRTMLKYTDGKESLVNGAWIIANSPVVGGYFVVFARGACAVFMSGADFLNRFAITPKESAE